MPDRKIIESISSYYPMQILRAFNNDHNSMKAFDIIIKGLRDIYRYFEPAFFEGHFLMCKHFANELCFAEDRATRLYDKNILLNRSVGIIIIQVLEDNTYLLWENEDIDLLKKDPLLLSYSFHKNKDSFWANGQVVDATISPVGSRYAPQFLDLMAALKNYNVDKVLYSSCNTFLKSWHDEKRLFFRSEGSGNNAPEKHMQESLHEYLRSQDSLRGISMETNREFNVGSDKPKPVDIRMQWREANRFALIEIKWIGSSKTTVSNKINRHGDPRVNSGYLQLKGYYDAAKRDHPTAIVKSILVVIDGRRNNITDSTTSIGYADGMYYQDKDVVVDLETRYYESIPGFEIPVRMFAAPICE